MKKEGNVATEAATKVAKRCRTKTLSYTHEDRIKAVRVLKDSGFNYVATEVATGISRQTLKSWYYRYRDTMDEGHIPAIAEDVEMAFSKKKADFIDSYFEKMGTLAEKSIERALILMEKECDLAKVNGTIKIVSDYMSKLHPSGSQESGYSDTTINLIQQTINQLNMNERVD